MAGKHFYDIKSYFMRKRNQIILHLGSNKGNRMLNLQQARKSIAQKIGKIIKASRLYDTDPWGLKEQARFLNQATWVETALPPATLLEHVLAIENELGRERLKKWGARIIDIDIIFYGQKVIDEPGLQIPHPLMQDRNFVLEPLAEIAATWQHPVLKKSVAQLATACKDEHKVSLT